MAQVGRMQRTEIDIAPYNGEAVPNSDIISLERKRKVVLAHDMGAGAPCLNCGDACPGLDLHYWRKICRACKCRKDEHDVHDEDADDPANIRIGKLFDSEMISNGHSRSNGHSFNEESVSNQFNQKLHIATSSDRSRSRGSTHTTGTQSDQISPRSDHVEAKETSFVTLSNGRVVTEQSAEQHHSPTSDAYKYRWVPPGLSRDLVAEYFSQLPPEDRPVIGTEGEQKRRQALEHQLPLHDCDPNACHALTVTEKHTMHKYVETIKKEVIGMGQVDTIHNKEHERGLADHSIEHCTTCQKRMNSKDIGVFTDHGRPESTWHPNCFNCCVCNERLVDMLYFYNDGKYYCGRHFGDTMYPRCAGCDELIFAKEYTRAEDKDWHLAHFCCFGCDKELGGYRYMVREPHPYCIECYMAKFARTCTTCKGKIGPDTQRIGHKDLNWHATPECFHCETCSESMVSKRFVVKGSHIFCSTDCKQQYFSRQPANGHHPSHSPTPIAPAIQKSTQF